MKKFYLLLTMVSVAATSYSQISESGYGEKKYSISLYNQEAQKSSDLLPILKDNKFVIETNFINPQQKPFLTSFLHSLGIAAATYQAGNVSLVYGKTGNSSGTNVLLPAGVALTISANKIVSVIVKKPILRYSLYDVNKALLKTISVRINTNKPLVIEGVADRDGFIFVDIITPTKNPHNNGTIIISVEGNDASYVPSVMKEHPVVIKRSPLLVGMAPQSVHAKNILAPIDESPAPANDIVAVSLETPKIVPYKVNVQKKLKLQQHQEANKGQAEAPSRPALSNVFQKEIPYTQNPYKQPFMFFFPSLFLPMGSKRFLINEDEDEMGNENVDVSLPKYIISGVNDSYGSYGLPTWGNGWGDGGSLPPVVLPPSSGGGYSGGFWGSLPHQHSYQSYSYDGNNGNGQPDQTPSDPCITQKAKDAKQYAAFYKGLALNKFNELITTVPFFPDEKSFSIELVMNPNNGTYNFNTTPIMPGVGNTADFTWGQNIYAAVHTHPIGAGIQVPGVPYSSYSQIPSATDVFNTMMAGATTGFTVNFVISLGSNTTDVYAIVVTDRVAVAAYMNNGPGRQEGTDHNFLPTSAIGIDFNTAYNAFKLQGLSEEAASANAMAFAISKNNTGLTLMKQNQDGTFSSINTTQTTVDGAPQFTTKTC